MVNYRKTFKLKKELTLSSWLCSVPNVKLFRDALVSDITLITIDWISRHLYFVLKESQNGTQIFDVDLEHKLKYPRELKICNTNSTIISFTIYPLLRYVSVSIFFYCDEIDIEPFIVIFLV
jgi:hypothetical protein